MVSFADLEKIMLKEFADQEVTLRIYITFSHWLFLYHFN